MYSELYFQKTPSARRHANCSFSLTSFGEIKCSFNKLFSKPLLMIKNSQWGGGGDLGFLNSFQYKAAPCLFSTQKFGSSLNKRYLSNPCWLKVAFTGEVQLLVWEGCTIWPHISALENKRPKLAHPYFCFKLQWLQYTYKGQRMFWTDKKQVILNRVFNVEIVTGASLHINFQTGLV